MIFNLDEEYKKLLEKKKEEIEKKDLELLEARNKKRYVLVKLKRRTITTEFGQLKFKRHIFKYYTNNKWKYVSLIDEELKLKKWSKLDGSLIEKIRSQIATGKRYRDIIDMFPAANISLMSISRIYKETKNESKRNLVNKKVKLQPGQRLYIFVDDAWVRVDRYKTVFRPYGFKSVNRTQVRIITFTTGYDPKTLCKKRKKLDNKKVSYLMGVPEMLNQDNLAEYIMDIGNKFYDNFYKAKLVVGGDGAQWIKTLASNLEADYIFDKYHAVKEMRRTIYYGSFKNSRFIFKTAYKYFCAGEYDSLMEVMKAFSTPDVCRYFKRNKEGIINHSKEWNIGVSAEAEVSRVVKSPLGNGARTYSSKVFKNILNERVFKINNNLNF